MKYSGAFYKSPSLKAVYSSLAEDGLKQAYEFYEANNPELAMKFMMAVRQTVDAIDKAR